MTNALPLSEFESLHLIRVLARAVATDDAALMTDPRLAEGPAREQYEIAAQATRALYFKAKEHVIT